MHSAKQHAFNGMWRGMLEQGFQRSIHDLTCAYRGSEGRRCVAGWLIKDEFYKPWMEGEPVHCPVIQEALVPTFDQFDEPVPISFILKAQEIHDYTSEPDELRKGLEYLAKDHGLKIPED